MSEQKAVALKYPEDADAPFIAAKGKGELAEKILEIAEENKIPVVKDELLSGILTTQEIGAAVPESAWKVVAKIFAFLVDNESKI